MRRWFRSNIRYTLIAAMDIDGFIPSTLEIVRRDEISDEGAAGTVDSTHFEQWIENHLLPTLGRFEYGEKRSIVVMDNASTHMRSKVRELIHGVGAYLLYTAPYSPDLNPIELGFEIYKKNLKRESILQRFRPRHFLSLYSFLLYYPFQGQVHIVLLLSPHLSFLVSLLLLMLFLY